MIAFRRILEGVLTSALVTAAVASDGTAQPTDSERVIAVVDAYHSALEAGDADGALGLLTEDALVLESGGLETRAEYEDHHLPGDMAFAGALKADRAPVRVTVKGDVAWAVSTSTRKGQFRDREIDSTGAELMVLTRTEAGWRITAIHWSSRNSRR